jgi:hypothetical protein
MMLMTMVVMVVMMVMMATVVMTIAGVAGAVRHWQVGPQGKVLLARNQVGKHSCSWPQECGGKHP